MNKLTRFVFKLFRVPPIKLNEVFTPTVAADLNYVARPQIDSLLSSEMSIPGKQIIVYGHSGSGKTSSVRNMLNKAGYRFIKTHCESSTTFDQIVLSAFDSLDMFVMTESGLSKKKTIKGTLASEYKAIKNSIATESTIETSVKFSRLLPPQLTPQKLAQFLGQGQIVWLIEDFHKGAESEKKRLADTIKIFVDNANDYPLSKIICIGACESARDLLQLDPNLQTRVSEISVPLLSDEEIRGIVVNGFNMLNITPCDSIVEKLVYYSDRLGASAHQMCLDICKGKGFHKSSICKRQLDDTVFQYAIKGFIERSSDTFRSIYEAAVRNELGWYILKTFSRNTMDKLSYAEVKKIVNSRNRNFSDDDIKAKLDELSSAAFGIIYFNSNSEKYSLTSPFWHRFLVLQFSIERSANTKKKINNQNPHLTLVNQNSRDSIVDNLMLNLIEDLAKLVNEK